MYAIPEDDYENKIKHAMLKSDLGQIFDISKEKKNLQFETDHQKRIR